MPDEPAQSLGRRFYRRIRPDNWQDEEHEVPQVTAFRVRDDSEGLSVFDADFASPRQVLEYQLNIWKSKAESDNVQDSRYGRKSLAKHGDTVDAMVDNDWGIVEISEATFRQYGFDSFSNIDTVNEIGHLTVAGTMADFELHGPDLADSCRVLSKQECKS